MSTHQPSASLLDFLRLSNQRQNQSFKPDEQYKIAYREDVPLSDCYIPSHINALVGIHPGAGFCIVEQNRVRSFQYTYLTCCESLGNAYEQCRIEVGRQIIELEGRHLDRLVDLVTERLLVKLYLPANFEALAQDCGPKEMTWVSRLTITTAEEN